MDSRAVTSSGPWAGDGARIIGRAVIAGGIAIGLMFGLGWWLLDGLQTDRVPVTEAALPRGGAPGHLLPPVTPSSRIPQAGSPAAPAPPLPSPSALAPTPPSAPVPVRPPAVTAPPPPTRPAAVLTAHYATTAVWDTGYVGQIAVTSTATGPQYVDLRLQLPAGVTVVQFWSNSAAGPSRSTSGGTVTFHDGPVSAQRSVVVGFETTKDAALASPRRFEPTSCTVNGNACG